MLASLSVLVSLAVLPFVNAQATDNNLGIKAIEAHFEQSHIVEDYLEGFAPVATLDLNYEGVGSVQPGQRLSPAESRPTPVVTVTPANSSVTLEGAFTIAMFDINAIGDELPNGPTRHWLVNGVTLDGNTVSSASANAITAYAGPGPAPGSGAHRYIVALYQQPAEFVAPEGFQEPTGVEPMDFKAYLENANLGPLVAANYIIVEEGTTTGTVVSTEAVISSTLLPASSGASSGAARPTSSGASGSDAPEPTSEEGSASKLSASTAVAAALFGGLAVLAL